MTALEQQLTDSLALHERNKLIADIDDTCALVEEIRAYLQDCLDRLQPVVAECAHDDRLHLAYGQAQLYSIASGIGYESTEWAQTAGRLIRESGRA